eukprot:10972006-Prorocentrum_lima.AAC.1
MQIRRTCEGKKDVGAATTSARSSNQPVPVAGGGQVSGEGRPSPGVMEKALAAQEVDNQQAEHSRRVGDREQPERCTAS